MCSLCHLYKTPITVAAALACALAIAFIAAGTATAKPPPPFGQPEPKYKLPGGPPTVVPPMNSQIKLSCEAYPWDDECDEFTIKDPRTGKKITIKVDPQFSSPHKKTYTGVDTDGNEVVVVFIGTTGNVKKPLDERMFIVSNDASGEIIYSQKIVYYDNGLPGIETVDSASGTMHTQVITTYNSDPTKYTKPLKVQKSWWKDANGLKPGKEISEKLLIVTYDSNGNKVGYNKTLFQNGKQSSLTIASLSKGNCLTSKTIQYFKPYGDGATTKKEVFIYINCKPVNKETVSYSNGVASGQPTVTDCVKYPGQCMDPSDPYPED